MQFRNSHTFGPQALPRLIRENGIIEKREKWRQATQATGDEAASQNTIPTACGADTLSKEEKRKIKLTTLN